MCFARRIGFLTCLPVDSQIGNPSQSAYLTVERSHESILQNLSVLNFGLEERTLAKLPERI